MKSRRVATVLLWLIPSTTLVAAPWIFDRAIVVSGPATVDDNHFHHLDSSGRHNIAVSDNFVAIAWEDDRDATPRIYLSYKQTGGAGFTHEIRISGDGESYEPSLAALSDGRFVVAWEEEGSIHARVASVKYKTELGPIVKLDIGPSTQVSLSTHDERAIAVYSQRDGPYGRIYARPLTVNDQLVLVQGTGCPVDPVPPTDEQLYPSALISKGRLLVAWEDRRPKHTIIMASVQQGDNTCHFSEPLRISEKPHARNLPYGSGHGVARVALGRYGDGGVYAVWADKRSFRDGYDIWGAPFLTSEGRFGRNEMVQDDFGGLAKQRHATISGHEDGTLAAAWDDEREGNTDIVMSWYEDGEWSEDWLVPVASGEGLQGNPSMVLDASGNLHLAWVERRLAGGVTVLKYAMGWRHKTP